MVESVIKCSALYLFLPCATRPNGSGHPGRCGNAACKGQNSCAELCPLRIPMDIRSRPVIGAAPVFFGRRSENACSGFPAQPLAALPPYGCGVPFTGVERHGGLQHALHCFYGARPPDLSLRGGRRPTWQSRGTCQIIGKPSAKSQLPSRDCHGPFGASQ